MKVSSSPTPRPTHLISPRMIINESLSCSFSGLSICLENIVLINFFQIFYELCSGGSTVLLFLIASLYALVFLNLKQLCIFAHVQVNPKEKLGKSLLFNVLKVPSTQSIFFWSFFYIHVNIFPRKQIGLYWLFSQFSSFL